MPCPLPNGHALIRSLCSKDHQKVFWSAEIQTLGCWKHQCCNSAPCYYKLYLPYKLVLWKSSGVLLRKCTFRWMLNASPAEKNYEVLKLKTDWVINSSWRSPPSPWRRRRSTRTNGHERDQPFKRLIFNSIKVFRLVGGSKSNQVFYFPRQSCFQGNDPSNAALLCLFDLLMCCENRFKGLLVWADWSKSFK